MVVFGSFITIVAFGEMVAMSPLHRSKTYLAPNIPRIPLTGTDVGETDNNAVVLASYQPAPEAEPYEDTIANLY